MWCDDWWVVTTFDFANQFIEIVSHRSSAGRLVISDTAELNVFNGNSTKRTKNKILGRYVPDMRAIRTEARQISGLCLHTRNSIMFTTAGACDGKRHRQRNDNTYCCTILIKLILIKRRSFVYSSRARSTFQFCCWFFRILNHSDLFGALTLQSNTMKFIFYRLSILFLWLQRKNASANGPNYKRMQPLAVRVAMDECHARVEQFTSTTQQWINMLLLLAKSTEVREQNKLFVHTSASTHTVRLQWPAALYCRTNSLKFAFSVSKDIYRDLWQRIYFVLSLSHSLTARGRPCKVFESIAGMTLRRACIHSLNAGIGATWSNKLLRNRSVIVFVVLLNIYSRSSTTNERDTDTTKYKYRWELLNARSIETQTERAERKRDKEICRIDTFLLTDSDLAVRRSLWTIHCSIRFGLFLSFFSIIRSTVDGGVCLAEWSQRF